MTALEETMKFLTTDIVKNRITEIAHSNGINTHLFTDFYQHIFIEVTNTPEEKLLNYISNNKLFNLITTTAKNQTTAYSSFYKQFRNSGFTKSYNTQEFNVEEIDTQTPETLLINHQTKTINKEKIKLILTLLIEIRQRNIEQDKALGHSAINLFIKHFIEGYTVKQLSEKTNCSESVVYRYIQKTKDQLQALILQKKFQNRLFN